MDFFFMSSINATVALFYGSLASLGCSQLNLIKTFFHQVYNMIQYN